MENARMYAKQIVSDVPEFTRNSTQVNMYIEALAHSKPEVHTDLR